MKTYLIAPVIAAVMLLSGAALAAGDTAPAQDAPAKSLVDVWDYKPPHHDKKHHDKKDGGKKFKSPEERKAAFEAERAKIAAMSETERTAYFDKKHAERKAAMIARIEQLPPEKQTKARARLEAFEAKREAMREELMALPPEERAARMKEMRASHEGKSRDGKKHEFAQRFQNKWDAASAEDRAAFCARTATECAGEDKPRLCAKATALCAE